MAVTNLRIKDIFKSPTEQQHGLMGRMDYVRKDCAVFPFDYPRWTSMWGRNTLMNLQVIFVYQHHVIDTGFIKHLSDKAIKPSQPCDTVIETVYMGEIPIGAYVWIHDGLVAIVSRSRSI